MHLNLFLRSRIKHGFSAEQNQQKGTRLSLGNSASFITACSYKRGLIVGSHFIVEINDLFTEIVTLQFYKADNSSQNKVLKQ